MTSYVTGALLMGQMAHEPYTLESYILTSGWMFACFILAASFTAELASFLSAEKVAALVSPVASCDIFLRQLDQKHRLYSWFSCIFSAA